MSSACAIYLGGAAVGLKQNPFGKDVANLSLYRALARHAPGDELTFLSFHRMDNDTVSATLYPDMPASKTVTTTTVFNPTALREAGTLLRASADLSDLAWMRRGQGDREFSITGLIHSLAPPAMREYIARAITAPIQPWDSMICTSPAVREALLAMYEGYSDFLAGRFGAPGGNPRPFPAMPVIPLGLEVEDVQARLGRPGVRDGIRARLDIAEDEIVVLWLGRLSFFEKGHPTAMFMAVEEAARRSGAKLRFLNVGWFPGGEQHHQLYRQSASAHAPSVKVEFLDGNDRDLVDQIWAGADIFISLVDNIQETFGITPIEAMAAGLPLVVSDWDGYSANVRHGVDGFLIPTLLPPENSGWLIAQRHILGMDSYQEYAGTVALNTAVDVEAAASALEALIREPDLRRRMGEAGLARARAVYDWPVVVNQLVEHWAEQAERRQSARSHDAGTRTLAVSPVKGNPFADFKGFATASLTEETILSARKDIPVGRLEAVRSTGIDRMLEHWRASGADVILEHLEQNGPSRFGHLVDLLKPQAHDQIARLVVWMAKMGLLDWRESAGDDGL